MNKFQEIFDAQKSLFTTGVTRTYEWRVDQLDRMARMIRENEARFQEAMAKDFKTASQEYIFETQASAGRPRSRCRLFRAPRKASRTRC
jgi:aldehyde dehydrogenase (NAD+)